LKSVPTACPLVLTVFDLISSFCVISLHGKQFRRDNPPR
jgi:hypothetical protein